MAFKKILIAIDSEPVAAHAADLAAELARRLGAEMAFIHVVDFSLGYPADTGVAPSELIALAKQDAKKLVSDFRQRLPPPSAALEFVPVGGPATEIVKAAGEETRLRVLALLAEAELTVSDLTDILRQSQPRISRHLKLLAEAGLVDRFREGTWAFFRLAERGGVADIARALLDAARSGRSGHRARPRAARLGAAARAAAAQAYFRAHAAEWDRIRKLHVADAAVEERDPHSARRQADPLAARSRHRHRAHARTVRPEIERGLGIDMSLDMLSAGARAAGARGPEALQRAAGRHLRSAGRQGFLRRRHHPSGAALPR